MKKIIYLFAVIGLMIASGCDPMKDINKDLDAIVDPVVGDDTYTLTDEDYDALDLSYGSFSNLDDAKAALPPFLAEKYPVWGKGSSVLLGYKLYVGYAFGLKNYNLDQDDYTFSGSDNLGFQFNATPEDYLTDIVTDNISNPSEGDYVVANYYQYTGGVYTVTPTVILDENFDYGATTGDLTTITTEWTGHSGSDPYVGYATSGLSMDSYPSSGIGGSVTIANPGGEDVNNEFTQITSGKVFTSALVNFSAINIGDYFLHFMDDGYGFTARVGAKDDGAGNILFGIGSTSFSAPTWGTSSFDLNTTYLIVASYDIETGTSNLYVLETVEDTEPLIPEATNVGDAGKAVQKIGIRQDFSDGPTGTIDGVRVANTWSAIMSNDVLEDEVIGDKTADAMFFAFTDGAWTSPSDRLYILSDADFESIGLTNFGSSTPPDDYLSTFLGIKFPYAQEGDELDVAYKYVSSSSGAQIRGNLYSKTDGLWTGYQSTINTTLQFAHDGSVWVPDNTIKYTLGGADYDYIVESLGSKYPSETANMASYGNFNGYSWDADMILEAVSNVLLKNNPSATEGQKYAVTYSIYDGTTHDSTIYVVLEGGTYVNQ